ncbi:MAG: hypothetical protein U9N61_02810 [Euryarchaeota archaeon]|nr:hypothetical protein [Euryarchaeota archaeon]
MQLTFRAKDAKIVRQGLQNLDKETPAIGRKQIRDTLNTIIKRMKVYPPEPFGSTYERTFKLKRNWKIKRLGNTGYRILNRARFKGKSYVKYVVGGATGEGQAWMHKGRWVVFRDIVDKHFEKLPDKVDKSVRRIMRKSGWK